MRKLLKRIAWRILARDLSRARIVVEWRRGEIVNVSAFQLYYLAKYSGGPSAYLLDWQMGLVIRTEYANEHAESA